MTYFGKEQAKPAARVSTAPLWAKAVGAGCGIGILAVVCLGVGLTFAVPVMLQAGFAVGSIALIVALFGGYQYFLYDRR